MTDKTCPKCGARLITRPFKSMGPGYSEWESHSEDEPVTYCPKCDYENGKERKGWYPGKIIQNLGGEKKSDSDIDPKMQSISNFISSIHTIKSRFNDWKYLMFNGRGDEIRDIDIDGTIREFQYYYEQLMKSFNKVGDKYYDEQANWVIKEIEMVRSDRAHFKRIIQQEGKHEHEFDVYWHMDLILFNLTRQ